MEIADLKPGVVIRGPVILRLGSEQSSPTRRPRVHLVQDPARLGWEPVIPIEHYHVGAEQIVTAGIAARNEQARKHE